MEKRFEQVILENVTKLTKGQQMIGEFVQAHLDRAAFMTSFELAAACGASQASVIRFATALGYGGFGEMQRSLQLEIRGRYSPAQQIGIVDGLGSCQDIIDSVSAWDSSNIRKTTQSNEKCDIESICCKIKQADRIFIYGGGDCGPAAGYLAQCLRQSHKMVCCVNQTGESPDRIITSVQHTDAVIAISMPIHEQSVTDICSKAKDAGAYILLIADPQQSGLCDYATDKLGCICGEIGVNGTLAPLISLCGILGCIMLK